MTETVKLKASDGHELDGYVSRPKAMPVAGLVVVQEAFGVNAHVRSVADGYAADGFLAVAPAMFDRIERGVELGYTGADREKGIALARQVNFDSAVKDVAAALLYLRENITGKSGVIGYCFGGTMAWLAATRLDPAAAVGYYGGVSRFAQETPHCPVMLHFGALDKHIPKEGIDQLHAAHPDVQIFWYENADHGFNCNLRDAYNPAAAKLARERSLEFLKKKLTGA